MWCQSGKYAVPGDKRSCEYLRDGQQDMRSNALGFNGVVETTHNDTGISIRTLSKTLQERVE